MLASKIAVEAFQAEYGAVPELLAFAPGRVNLIGEHTDYNEGFVMPAAIGEGVYVAGRRAVESRLYSASFGRGESFDTSLVEPGGLFGFSRCAAGVAWAFRRAGLEPANLEASIYSDLPSGAGVASSSALEMAFAILWNEIGGFRYSRLDLAKVCRICENEFVSVKSGLMDPLASAMGEAGHALLIDMRSLAARSVTLPENLELALCQTGVSRSLERSAYNERRAQCEAASKALDLSSLREASLESLDRLGDPLRRRARHVVSENQRCLDFAAALARSDFAAIGRIMRESHESLREDYEVTGPALDAMAEACWRASGCVGARMTGAGFGGACIALVSRGKFGEFRDATLEQYAKSGPGGAVSRITASQGAKVLLE